MLNRKTILMILMGLSLNACAMTDKYFGGKDSDRSGQVVYVNPDNSGSAVGIDGNTPSVVTTAVDDLGSYNKLAGQYSKDSSVELFSLDQPGQPLGQAMADGGSVMSYGLDDGMAGRASRTDPSVTVFPFSDDLYPIGAPTNMHTGSFAQSGFYAGADDVALFTGNPNTIYFDHGSAALNATARQVIASVARSYGGRVHVGAHASQRAQTNDPVERGILNFEMSMKRAMAVTKQLIRAGVPAESIKTTAYGDAQPAVPETSRDAEAKNRRVQILTGAQ